MTRFNMLALPGILALVLAIPTHTLQAQTPSNPAATSHVLVGMTPSAGFEVTCDDSLLCEQPVVADALGILRFTVDRGSVPGTGLVCLRPPAPPAVVSCMVSEADTCAALCWQTDRPARSHVEYGTSSGYYPHYSTDEMDLAIDHGAALDALTSETTYYYRIVSTGAFGDRVVTSEFTFDTCPPRPVITDVTAVDVTATSFSVVWTTSTPSDSRVEYGSQESCDDGFALLSSLVTGHEVIVDGLETDETYYFRVRSVDACGCETLSGVTSVTTSATELLHVIGVSVLGTTQATATIRWWTSVPATSQIAYGTTPAYGHFSDLETDLHTYHLVVLDGLAPETLHHFTALSTDEDGNQASSADLTFTTAPSNVPDRLMLYNVSADVDDGPIAIIRWTTNMPATTFVEYGPSTSYGESIAGSEVAVQHSVVLEGLEPQMLYHFRVGGSAVDGIEAVSSDMVFTTYGVADLSPPSTPEGLTATSGDDFIDLSWETPPGTGADEYTVYRRREGQVFYSDIATVDADGTTYRDANVQPGTFYDYAVAARDAAGNESDLSAKVTVMAGAGAAGQMWVFPNPVASTTSIRFAPPASGAGAGRTTLRIYDAGGRLVRTLNAGSSGPEPRTVSWNARDDSGTRVASGTYFCVVANRAGTLRTKLLVLR